MGLPIVEAEEDGSFVVTKHPNTGGLVSVHTVAEQILYEIGPPAYMTPDVVARFDSVHLEQEGPDRVRVTGARGEPAPEKLKVSISYHAGWRAFGRLAVTGPEALAKANKVAEAFWDARGRQGRVRAGAASVHRLERVSCAARNVRARRSAGAVCGARSRTSARSTRASRRSWCRACSARCPGITYIADQGRPKASEVVAFWPALVSREAVTQRVIIGDEEIVREVKGQGARGKGQDV